jgi:uncharacterized iron-regulated membrane protein
MMSRARYTHGRNRLQRLLHRWHRRIGVAAALLVLLLAGTGIALSHAVALRLNERMLDAPWLLALYRSEPVSPPRAMPSTAGWLVWIDNHLYLEGTPVADHLAAPIGTAESGDMIVIANHEQLLLLTMTGELLERLDRSSLPDSIDAIGTDAQGRIAVRSEGRVLISADLLQWQPVASNDIRWADIEPEPPRAVLATALSAFRGNGVSASRVIADLHSGRFLGPVGPWLMDASAIALILLAGSGLWMWWKQRPRYRHHRSHHR